MSRKRGLRKVTKRILVGGGSFRGGCYHGAKLNYRIPRRKLNEVKGDGDRNTRY